MWIFVTLLVILLSLLLLLMIFHYSTKGRKYWYFRNVPYREPCPIFGNFGATFIMKKSYSKMLHFLYEQFYNEKYVGIFQARRPTLMLIDLDIVKSVFSTEFQSFSDRVSVSTDTKREPLLRNLANMSGAEWKAMRQVVTPTFSSAKMKAMFPLIAACGKTLEEVLSNESLEAVDVPNIMTRYTTDVIGSCAFGVDPGALKNPESPFLKMSQKMFKVDRVTLLKRYCRVFFPKLFKFLNLKSYSPDVEVFFTTIISQVLTERRNGVQRHDFLQLMLNEQNKDLGFSMTDALITSNSFIFMLAGLETSSTTLSFCLYELAKHKEVQDAARKEIRECLERYKELNYDSVIAMRFVAQVVVETLRLHPATPLTTRLCTAPCKLNEKLSLKLKDPVLIPIQCIQRDDRHFPDGNKFDPSRLGDNLTPPGFMAFGEGPRSCPGGRFAQLMVTTALAVMLSKYELEPCALTTPSIQYDPRSVILKNKGGIWLRFSAI
ncbi:cytochrome P450 6j1-like [Anticarsia gemmatalis]|uniref:cytochrome P450 6j1-like n=1 Tax=Anticarsia gemmatalis TaxID=129554 RepID=UPI003F775C26